MNEQLETFIKNAFGLEVEDIEKMSDEEYDELYEKAMAQEEILSVQYPDEHNENLEFAADFVDWLYSFRR